MVTYGLETLREKGAERLRIIQRAMGRKILGVGLRQRIRRHLIMNTTNRYCTKNNYFKMAMGGACHKRKCAKMDIQVNPLEPKRDCRKDG